MPRRAAWTLLFLASIATRVASQAPSSPARAGTLPERPLGAWLDVGAGAASAASSGADVGLSIGARLQLDRVLWSAQWDGVVTGWSSDVDQFALLLGVA